MKHRKPPVGRDVVAGERGLEQSFGRAAAILDVLAAGRRSGLRFTDIVTETGFSKATVHRLLAGMTARGLVDTSPEGLRFHIGYRVAGWGAAARDRHGLLELAGPHLDALAAATADTVYLSVRSGPLALCVAHREGSNPIRVLPLRPGDRNALGVGSASLALLAFLPDPEVDGILADPEHRRAREKRGVSENEIRALIGEARQRGYAFVHDLIPGIAAIGVPVAVENGVPRAALAVAAIAARLRGSGLDDTLASVRATAADLGALSHAAGPDFA